MDDAHEKMGTDNKNRLRKGLQSALSAGHDTGLETARYKNYLAYLVSERNKSEALDMTEEALSVEGEGHNLVSLANKTVILWQLGRRREAGEELSRLEALKESADFDYLKVKAKAELAFCYTRLGPKFFPRAISIFTEVLVEARKPEKWLWTFGLALTKRRMLRLDMAPMFKGKRNLREESFEVLRLYLDVINNTDSRNLNAKAHAEITELIAGVTVDRQLKRDLAVAARMTPTDASERALQLDGEDHSVLCKTSKTFRRSQQLERAAEVLEKALTIRKSSTAYHHLGLVYKALARDKKREMLGLPKPFDSRDIYSQTTAGSNEGVLKSLKKALSSPPKITIEITKTDPIVAKAMKCFEKSIAFSEGHNSFAKYDLALMHRNVNERDKALQLLQELQDEKRDPGHTSILVTCFEQSGWILKELSEAEEDVQKKEHLAERARSMLNRALLKAVQLYSKTSQLRGRIGKVYDSFSELLRKVDESKGEAKEKLKEKARLFKFISDNRKSLALLDEIQRMSPEEERNPEYLKLRIENYVEMKKFDDALAFIALLKRIAPGRATMDLFADKQYLVRVYVMAARQALLQNLHTDARDHFHAAFAETFPQSQVEAGSSSDSESMKGEKSWDVMMFFDDEESEGEGKAKVLASVLKDVCGLRVTLMAEDIPYGSIYLKEMTQVMSMSRLVVVLPGPEEFWGDLDVLLQQAALRAKSATVTLLTGCGHVPQILKTGDHSWMVCPPELLTPVSVIVRENLGIAAEQARCGMEKMGVDTGQAHSAAEKMEVTTQQLVCSAEKAEVATEQSGRGTQNDVATEKVGVATEQSGRGTQNDVTTEKVGVATEQNGRGTQNDVTTEKVEVATEQSGRGTQNDVTTEKVEVATEQSGRGTQNDVTTEKAEVATEQSGRGTQNDVATEKAEVATEQSGRGTQNDVTTEKVDVATEQSGRGAQKDVTTDKMGSATGSEKMVVTTETLGATTDQACRGAEKLGAATDQACHGAEKLGATTDQACHGAEKLGATTDQACSEAEKLGATTDQACRRAEKLGATTDQACSEAEKLGATTDQACRGAEKLGATTDQACSEADKLGATTDQACSEAEKLGATTDQACSEAAKLGATTDQACSEAEKLGATTDQVRSEAKQVGASAKQEGCITDDTVRYTEQQVRDICKLFCFLLGINR
ncbi:hypothetical protein BaRGS_00009886 [Batillaria attramentaria]|uniref:TPR-like protein n=1 Tax=Batillaria attramentaria TaxID=370345 RepID=A0ABD0LGS8_9CAEN